MFENRRWLVIPTSLTGSINFNEVLQTSESLRLSVDGSKTFVKYEINQVTASYDSISYDAETGQETRYTVEAGVYGRPSFYSEEYTEYTHSEILKILNTAEWTTPFNIENAE
jgi:hypothetical protein